MEEEAKVATNKNLREVDTVKEVASKITMTINNQQMNIKEREMSMRKTNNNSLRSNTTIAEVGVSLKKKILDKILITTIMMLSSLKKKLNNIKRNMMTIQKKMEITSIKEKRTKTVAEKEVEEITVEGEERKNMFKSLETKVIIKSTNLKDLMIMKINAQEAEKINVPEVVAVEEAEVVIETTIKTIEKAQLVEINKDKDIKRIQNLKTHLHRTESSLSIKKIWLQKQLLKSNLQIDLQAWSTVTDRTNDLLKI